MAHRWAVVGDRRARAARGAAAGSAASACARLGRAARPRASALPPSARRSPSEPPVRAYDEAGPGGSRRTTRRRDPPRPHGDLRGRPAADAGQGAQGLRGLGGEQSLSRSRASARPAAVTMVRARPGSTRARCQAQLGIRAQPGPMRCHQSVEMVGPSRQPARQSPPRRARPAGPPAEPAPQTPPRRSPPRPDPGLLAEPPDQPAQARLASRPVTRCSRTAGTRASRTRSVRGTRQPAPNRWRAAAITGCASAAKPAGSSSGAEHPGRRRASARPGPTRGPRLRTPARVVIGRGPRRTGRRQTSPRRSGQSASPRPWLGHPRVVGGSTVQGAAPRRPAADATAGPSRGCTDGGRPAPGPQRSEQVRRSHRPWCRQVARRRQVGSTSVGAASSHRVRRATRLTHIRNVRSLHLTRRTSTRVISPV